VQLNDLNLAGLLFQFNVSGFAQGREIGQMFQD